MAVPTGTTRSAWLAEREPPAAEASARCPASEAEVVASAVRRSSEAGIKRAQARATRAAAEVPDADGLSLRLTNFRSDIGFADRAEATLRYSPARPGTIAAERDSLAREADELDAEARDEERQLRFEVRTALARARAADGLERVAAVEVEAAAAEVARIRAAVSRKAASELELAAAEVDLADVEGERMRQQAERERWLGATLAYGGYGADCALSLSPYTPRAAGALVALEQRALASHPLIDARWAAERRVDADWHGPMAEAWPWLDFVQVGLERRELPLEDELHGVFGLAIDLPIFQWGGEASDAHDAARDAAQEETRLTLQAIRMEVAGANAELVAARARAAGIPGPLADERREALKKAVASGYADPRDLLKVERDMRKNDRRRVEATLAIEEAAARLEAAIGDAGGEAQGADQ